MKKISQLTNKDCIHCETEEEATAICKLLHKAGKKWYNGDSYLKYNGFSTGSITMYHDMEGNMRHFSYYEDNGYTVHKAKDFIGNNEKEENTALGVTAALILLCVSLILLVLLLKPYTVLISCDNGYIYQRHGLYPMTEVKKLEKILNTGDNNIYCEVEMFAR